MNLLLKTLMIVIVASLSTANQAESQTMPSPIQPEQLYNYHQLGLVIGFGQNFQSGKYYVDCDDCVFEDGVKFGFTIGLNYEYNLSNMINIGVMGLFDDFGLKNSFVENEKLNVTSDDGSYNEIITVPFRHTAEAKFTTFSIMPHIKFHPVKFVFFDLGFSMGIPLSSNIKHEKELTKTTARLSNGAIVDIRIEGTQETKVVLEDKEFPEVNKPQFSIVPMIGLNFIVNKKIFLRPFFMYRLPISNYSDKGEDFMINSWRIMFELSLKL